jgi:hypothetical protein
MDKFEVTRAESKSGLPMFRVKIPRPTDNEPHDFLLGCAARPLGQRPSGEDAISREMLDDLLRSSSNGGHARTENAASIAEHCSAHRL